MGIFGSLFKSQPQSDDEVKRSSEVMENLKKYRGEETGKWLSMMRDPSLMPKPAPAPKLEDVDKWETLDGEVPYSPPVSAQYTTTSYDVKELTATAKSSMPRSVLLDWVNKLFSEFAVQASNFNSSAQGTHLVVTVHAPEFEWQEARLDEYTPEKKIASFKGYLATVQWGMLIQGSPNKIEIFVVPSEEILTFELHGLKKTGYAPFMTIDTSEIETAGVWHIGGSAITFDTISLLVQELLGDLVRVATGSMDESELFAQENNGLKLGETVAQGYTTPPQPGGPASAGSAAAPQAPQSPLSRMTSWSAADQLLRAIDQDMPWLVQLKSDTDSSNDTAKSAPLEDLISRLRSISGQIDALRADYHPAKGSKYNAS